MQQNRLQSLYPWLPSVPTPEEASKAALDAMRRMGTGNGAITAAEVADFVLDLWGGLGHETYPAEVVEEIDKWLADNWGYSCLHYYDDIATLAVLVGSQLPKGRSVKLLLDDRVHHSPEIQKRSEEISRELDTRN